ncbi:hypothetical protein K1719_035840 [Acacia pycnantha]|nr:hypothetical protein K1719_035840 [Acacia pycnantha]
MCQCKIHINGSKLAGKVKIESVSEIPEVHGTMREAVKGAHSKMQVKLNSGVGTEKAIFLRDLTLGLGFLEGISTKKCPADSSLERAFGLYLSEDSCNFVYKVKMLLETVWNIVAWEVVTLEPVELTEKIQAVGANGDNTKPEK